MRGCCWAWAHRKLAQVGQRDVPEQQVSLQAPDSIISSTQRGHMQRQAAQRRPRDDLHDLPLRDRRLHQLLMEKSGRSQYPGMLRGTAADDAY